MCLTVIINSNVDPTCTYWKQCISENIFRFLADSDWDLVAKSVEIGDPYKTEEQEVSNAKDEIDFLLKEIIDAKCDILYIDEELYIINDLFINKK